MRGSPAYSPKRVGLATLTYVPALEGYFREAREVISVHLASLRASLHQECNICVFDNGSCPEIIAYLEEQWRNGLIDWLCLSNHNLGKNGALNWIFSSMPNEFIGFADYDVFFREGWLERTLEIFGTFEYAGMVSAQPVFFDFLRGEGKTANAVQEADGLRIDLVQPRQEIVDEYCDGINASDEMRKQFRQTRLQVAINEERATRAVTSATDMQFMLSKKVARELVPLPIAGALTAKDAIDIPRGIEALGYWILSTEEPLVRHMGNSILGRNIPEIDAYLSHKDFRGKSQSVGRSKKGGIKGSIRIYLQKLLDRSPALRKGVTRIYDGLFSLLYEERR
jgi:hypothetical protein